MGSAFAPQPGSRHVLGGISQLGLAMSSPEVIQPYRPPPLQVERANYAQPVRLHLPPKWKTSAVKRVDVIFASDDSGSMYGPSGDPRGVRRAAALSVVQVMASGSGGRVGVVHWGSSAPPELVLPLTAVRRTKSVNAGLEIPPTLGGNNFPAALARAREVLEAGGGGADRIPLVLAITDGIEEVGVAAEAQLRLLPPSCVHVLLVDHSHGCSSDLEAGWSALPLGSFTRLDVLDTRRMAWQAAEIVAQAVGVHMPPLLPVRKRPSLKTKR